KSGWMVPTRVMDTREGLGGPTLGPSTVRTLDLSSSGVPADATAVALNLTATRATVNSFVAVYPTSSARPDVSALNTVEGLDVSNGIVVGLGPNRRIDLYNHDGSVDLVVDVMGWFGPAGVNKITPARVLDTRSTGGPMAAGGTRVVQVTGGAVPAGAKAVAVNVTAVAPSEDTYVTAWPGVGPKPDASAVNAVGGRTVANAMVLGLDNAGRMSLYNHAGATDVLVDVLGWFDAGGFNAIEPTRRMDTREGLGGVVLGPGEARSLDVLPAGVTAGQVAAVSLNITATESSVPSFLSIWPSDGSQPNASVVNMEAGQTVANAHLVDVGADGKIVIFNNTGSSHVVVDITGWVPVG
ncbi:MAG: hypothetical protein OEY23_12785, partial [Acidimicrobiia bacterium]|nr:hypothetical protein [Acidimicrobiia bacterium]